MIAGNNCIAVDCGSLSEICEEDNEIATEDIDLPSEYSWSLSSNGSEGSIESTPSNVDCIMLRDLSIAQYSPSSQTPPVPRSERIEINRTAAELEYSRRHINKITLSYLRLRGLVHLCSMVYIFIMVTFVYPLCSGRKSKPTECGKIVLGFTLSMLVLLLITHISLCCLEKKEVATARRNNNDPDNNQ
ncbi:MULTISPECIES: hypothetical protein [Candidatus Ichthyocystis]|uniref:Putative membrane protein n=1 Tax=Candidatus Ichthyocystis hellenicum TaxID=1561003 RepID=A0A0S4M9Y4_9BURK|nr:MULTISPECIES: hypothetical protein [Ichthyocystis]CUT18308.1 putative membrane protein [Candidatus Ichthyocystis hellenicum]